MFDLTGVWKALVCVADGALLGESVGVGERAVGDAVVCCVALCERVAVEIVLDRAKERVGVTATCAGAGAGAGAGVGADADADAGAGAGADVVDVEGSSS